MPTIEVKDSQEVYLSDFALQEKRLAARGPAWLNEIRRAAIHRFAELGFPTTRQEAWRFTNVAPLASTRFRPAQDVPAGSVAEELKGSPFADLDCSRLVFVNGRYARELSSPHTLPAGVKALSLAEALTHEAGVTEQHLARYASYQDHPFVALNTAFFEDGAFIEVPKGLVLDKPIHLVFVSTAGPEPTVSHPRNLIILGRESQVTLIEAHIGLGLAPRPGNSKLETRNRVESSNFNFPNPSFEDGPVYFTNAVTEIVAEENAIVHYAKLQRESLQAFHFATLQVQQERTSNVSTFAISFGAALSREEVNALLDGEGAECLLNGLYVVTGRQHIDNYTTLDHAKAHCNSRELYKGVLDDKSSGVFHGRIVVRQDAQKTDAKQSNKNLLLSDDATINTKPQLEIYANDVKCTHGATVGQIDHDAVFYLRSRGIGREEARSLLTFAFTNEIIGRIKHGPLRDRLKDELFRRLGVGPSEEA